MKIDFTSQLHGENFEPEYTVEKAFTCVHCNKVNDPGPEKRKPFTLATAAIRALWYEEKDNPTSPDDMVERFSIATRIHLAGDNGGIVDLKVKEVEIIRKCAVRRWQTVFYGQIVAMLEPVEPETAPIEQATANA